MAEALVSRVTESTAVYDGNGDRRQAMARGADGWPTLMPVTQVVASVADVHVSSSKTRAGKYAVNVELHIEAYSNPLWEGKVSDPGAYVEREAQWLQGRAFSGLGRVTDVQVVKGSAAKGKAAVTTFKIAAESQAA